MVQECSVTVQRHRHSGNLKVYLADGLTIQPTQRGRFLRCLRI